MQTIEILRGIPASGKSSYAKDKPSGWARINNDDLRAMLHASVWSKENEKLVGELRRAAIRAALEAGQNVVVDNVNCEDYHWREVTKIAQEFSGDVKVVEVKFFIPLANAIERDAKRPNGVGKQVIENFWKKFGFDKGMQFMQQAGRCEEFLAAKAEKAPEFDPSLPSAIICDIDGTLAIMGDRNPYDASRCCEVDKPNDAVVKLIEDMYHHKKIFVSAREDKYFDVTEKFINVVCDIGYDELHMRASGDFRKDAVIKKEIYEQHIKGKYNVLFVLDDRNQVVDMWRSIGLSCFQVAEGNF